MTKTEREKLMLGERCLRVCGVSGVHHDCVCVLAPALFGFSLERVWLTAVQLRWVCPLPLPLPLPFAASTRPGLHRRPNGQEGKSGPGGPFLTLCRAPVWTWPLYSYIAAVVISHS